MLTLASLSITASAIAQPADLPLLEAAQSQAVARLVWDDTPGQDTANAAWEYAAQTGLNGAFIALDWRDLVHPDWSIDTAALQADLDRAVSLDQEVYLLIGTVSTGVLVVPDAFADPADETKLASGLAFDSPIVISRFGELLDAVVPLLVANDGFYLAVGNEVDVWLQDNPSQQAAYLAFVDAARTRVHAMNPDLAVGASMTSFVQSDTTLAQAVWSVTDEPSFTYYPLDAETGWIARPPSVVEQDLDALLTLAGDKQVVFQEIGYPTGFTNGNIGASEELQREFIERFIPAMRARPSIRFWSLYGSRDVPQWFVDLILKSGDDPNLAEFITTLGLVREDGSPKPAYNELLSQIEGDPCALWTKHPNPVWEGFFMAADPCVIRDGDTYRMYFTGFLPEPDRSFIGMATSPDGINWDWATPIDANNPVSIALDGRPGEWDQFLETAHVMKVGNEFWMYYTGYAPAPGRFVNPFEIGLATSPDGINWTRVSNDPVYRLAPSGPDNGAMTSQAVVRWNGMFYMVYFGWEIDDHGGFADFRIRGATSPDGINWRRRAQPVFGTPSDELPWLDLALEPSLMQASDGMFYLFISTDDAENTASPTSIAVLRSCHPFGPWEACPDPIVTMTQPWEDNEIIAPHVMEDDGKLRMWYHGLTFNDAVTGERYRIGYAETNFNANPARFDVDGDGRVDIDDLYEQHRSPVDINLDGMITPADKAALEAFLRRCELRDMAAGRR